MEPEKSEDVQERIELQRELYEKNKKEKGEGKPNSDFMNYCDNQAYKFSKFYPHLTPIQKSTKLWEEFIALQNRTQS